MSELKAASVQNCTPRRCRMIRREARLHHLMDNFKVPPRYWLLVFGENVNRSESS
jgi:hypothetical protein